MAATEDRVLIEAEVADRMQIVAVEEVNIIDVRVELDDEAAIECSSAVSKS